MTFVVLLGDIVISDSVTLVTIISHDTFVTVITVAGNCVAIYYLVTSLETSKVPSINR